MEVTSIFSPNLGADRQNAVPVACPLGDHPEHRGGLVPFWRVFLAYGLCFSTLGSGICRLAQMP
jgi:hypothetical protein